MHDEKPDIYDQVLALIDTGKEGSWWDFKQKHHDNNAKLLHDILCLANGTEHKGPRYLIFGIADNCSVTGVADGSAKKQADIIDLLRDSNFAGNMYPDVRLHDLSLKGRLIQVLEIADRPLKPYYLSEQKRKDKTIIPAGAVYTRTQDSNTPVNGCASTEDIANMWRERFGILTPPLERITKMLQHPDEWENPEDQSFWYHRRFPEFTVRRSEDSREIGQGVESWVRAGAAPTGNIVNFDVMYHQTVLRQVCCVDYDDCRRTAPIPTYEEIPFPAPGGDEASEHNWYFWLSADSFEFCFLEFLYRESADTLLQDGLRDRSSRRMPVLLFCSIEEKAAFDEWLKANPEGTQEQDEISLGREVDKFNRKDVRVVATSRMALRRLDDFRFKCFEAAMELDSFLTE